MVPELFVHEINKLDWEDRKRFAKPKLTFSRADGDMLEVDVTQNLALNRHDELEQLQDKAMQMEMYLYEQTQDLYEFYYNRLKEEITEGNHIGV